MGILVLRGSGLEGFTVVNSRFVNTTEKSGQATFRFYPHILALPLHYCLSFLERKHKII